MLAYICSNWLQNISLPSPGETELLPVMGIISRQMSYHKGRQDYTFRKIEKSEASQEKSEQTGGKQK